MQLPDLVEPCGADRQLLASHLFVLIKIQNLIQHFRHAAWLDSIIAQSHVQHTVHAVLTLKRLSLFHLRVHGWYIEREYLSPFVLPTLQR